MAETIMEFWKRFKPSRGELHVHPDDREWMETYWSAQLKQPVLDSWDSYVKSARFGENDKDTDPHLSLLPIPFLGNLEKAKVIICLTNPGFTPLGYYAEDNERFRAALRKNLRQGSGSAYPFVALDPQFAWTDGFSWWESRLRPIIDRLMKERLSYKESLRVLSNGLAVLELFPYHSRDRSALKGMTGNRLLPSVLKMKEFLAATTHQKHKLTIVMRSHKHWHDELTCSKEEAGHYVHGPHVRGMSFKPELRAAIVKKLID